MSNFINNYSRFAAIFAAVVICMTAAGCNAENSSSESAPESSSSQVSSQESSSEEISQPSEEEIRLSHFPKQTGPDEEGKFPPISAELYNNYIEGRTGEADTEKPDKLPDDWRKSPALKRMIEENYPDITDWKLVYENRDYALRSSFDPYNYIFRKMYMPSNFVILKTEQSEMFDLLFLNLNKSCSLFLYDTEVVPAMVEEYCTFNTAFSEDLGGINNTTGAEVLQSGRQLWLPAEKKAILIGLDESEEVISLENLTEKPDFDIYRINRTVEVIPQADVNSKDCILTTYVEENEKYSEEMYYYSFEDKALNHFDNVYVPYFNSLRGSKAWIQQKNEIMFYDLSAEDPTVPYVVIGDKGRGLQGEDIRIEAVTENRSVRNRYALIYRENDDWRIATFDKEGKVDEDYELDIRMAEIFGHEFVYEGNIIYIDNMVLNDNYNFATNAKKGIDHSSQLFAIERGFLDYMSYTDNIKPLYYPIVAGMPFDDVSEITCWREIAERIIDLQIKDKSQHFWTVYKDGKIHIDEMMKYINMYFDVDKETVVSKISEYMEGDMVIYQPHEDFVPELVWYDNYQDWIEWNGNYGTMRYSCIDSDLRKAKPGMTYLITVKYDASAPVGWKYVSMKVTEPMKN